MYHEIILLLRKLVALQEQLLTNSPLPADEWLDSADVKQLLKVSNTTLYRLTKTGILQTKDLGGKRYYLKSSLFGSKKDPTA